MSTTTYTGTLTVCECANCHTDFGMTPRMNRDRRDDHKTFYCPAGHQNYYPQQSDEEKLRAQLAREEGRVAAERVRRQNAEDRLAAVRRSRSAVQGHLTRARKRAAAGVCPCCNRSFKQVRDHMRGQHPKEYAEIFPKEDA